MNKILASVKGGFEKVNACVNTKLLTSSALAVTAVAATSVSAFAAEGDPLPTIAITTDMLKPLVDGVISNVGVILPVGIGLFAILLGIRLIPSVVSRFLKV